LARVAVLAAALTVFAARLGDRAVVSEESRWAEIAREMVQTGDWLHPTINGQPYLDKPVGSYWLIVAAATLTGRVDEWSARLPSAIAGVVGVWAVMRLGRRLYDERTGVLAGAILATSFGFAFYSRRATADVETVTGVLVSVWIYAAREERWSGAWVVGLWVWMAAVSLTKGLLGFALPVAVFGWHGLVVAWTRRTPGGGARGFLVALADAQRWAFNRWTVLAVPLAAGVYFAPFILAGAQAGGGLEMVWRENVRRFVAPHNHAGPAYLYVGVVFVLAAPWSVFLPAALLPPGKGARTAGDRLAQVYFWAVFAFFTAAASRRSYYLLPVLPAVALLVARALSARAETLPGVARTARTVGWVVFVAGVLLVGPAVLLLHAWLPAAYRHWPLPARDVLVAGWVIASGGVVTATLRPTHRPAVAVAVCLAASGYLFVVALPAADDLRTRREFLTTVHAMTDDNPNRLGLYHARDVVFDFGRTVREFSTPEDIRTAVTDGRGRWVLTSRRRLADLPPSFDVLAEEGERPWEPADHRENKLVLLEFPPLPRPGGRR
jgi:4-amino-4-deoxy-L-arabinose transferase-like glycosyltransferase